MLRGVSGGERKRVTTGEMTFGNKLVYFMDEISTGLDSSATFDIISTQRRLAKTLGKTMVISLLQPSPEVFELFDDVMLLNGGYVMYYGPRAELGGYFEDLGLKGPASRDMADFLLDLGTNKQRQYESGPAPRFAPQFADVFEKSEVRFRTMNNLRNPSECSTEPISSVAHTPEFRQDFLAGTATVLAREFKILAHDLAAVKIRVFMALVIALLYGTTFYQFETTNAQVFMGLAGYVICGKFALIPSILATRNVVYKQRGANFYRTSSFVIASFVKEIPLVLVEILLFGTLTYWMCGFVASMQSYLIYLLLLFVVNMAYIALFFFIASACPNINVANPIAMLAHLFLATFSGILITKGSTPAYLSWVYWISPHGWGIHAVAVNQYREARFNTCVYDGVDYCARYELQMGEYMLSLYGVPAGSPSESKASIDLLKGISGYALPGTITALMGSSGAGKTTLMDVIAGRKTAGKITGSILLNDHPATEIAVRRATGYCEQMDIHSEASTFREALTFSAFLRQDAAAPDSEKYDCV
ncbi:hypothetical protein PInf_005127 [Phytophthora infestans]|nr:hypothetical protein PInf_005127 [Phytophthora infestans]